MLLVLMAICFWSSVVVAVKQVKKPIDRKQNAAASFSPSSEQESRQRERSGQTKVDRNPTEKQCLEFVDNCPVSKLPTETFGSDTDPAHFKLFCDLTVEQGPIVMQGNHDVPLIDDTEDFPEGVLVTPSQVTTKLFKKVDGICHFDPNKEALLFKFVDKALFAPGASVDLTFVTTVWENLKPLAQQHPIPVSFTVKNLLIHPVMDEGSYNPTEPLRFVTSNVLVEQDCPAIPLTYSVIVGVGGHQDTKFLVQKCLDANPPCAVPGVPFPNITNQSQRFLRVGFRKCFSGPGNRNYVKLTIYPGADDEVLSYTDGFFDANSDCQTLDNFLGAIGVDNGETFIKHPKQSVLRIDPGLLGYTVYSPNLKDSKLSGVPNPLCGVDIIRCDPCLDDCLDDLSADQLVALLELLQSIIGGDGSYSKGSRLTRTKNDAERLREKLSKSVKHPGLDIVFDELVRSVSDQEELTSMVRSVQFAIEKRHDE